MEGFGSGSDGEPHQETVAIFSITPAASIHPSSLSLQGMTQQMGNMNTAASRGGRRSGLGTPANAFPSFGVGYPSYISPEQSFSHITSATAGSEK